MKRIVIIVTALAAAAFNASAAADWKGKVVDSKGEPVAYANVALLAGADSTVVGGVTTGEDGTFFIPSDSRDGLLMVAMLGYKTVCLVPCDNAVITLEEDSEIIEGSVAVAVLPKTKLSAEGLQTQIRGSVLENVGTAEDVLARTPGIIRSQNGLEVIGKGKPEIYINGHKVTDSGELSRLQSCEIQSIEVITNPGAQYDASVRSVVRIRTVRRQGDGFGFNTALSDAQSLRKAPELSPRAGDFPFNDPSANFNFNYRKNSVDIFAGINAVRNSSLQSSHLVQKSVGRVEFMQEGDLVNEYVPESLSLNGGANWQIADNHSVGVKLDWNVIPSAPQHEVVLGDVFRDNVFSDRLLTVGDYSNGDRDPYHLSGNAYYNGRAGKLGIDFNFDFYVFGSSQNSEVIESSLLQDASIRTESENDGSLYAAELVLSYPVWKGMLQFGTEETFTRTSETYSITGTEVPSSASDVAEDNIAVFASYGLMLGKGQLSAGLRYEHVKYSFDDLGADDGSFSRKYDNIFPSLSYARAVGPVQLMASYSAKTVRPDFSMLSNAIRYNTRFILQSGNAALQPQTLNNLNLMANWKWATLVLDYTRVDNLIATWASWYNDKDVSLVKPRNLETPFRQLSVYMNFSPTVGIWNLNYTVGAMPQWLTIDAPDPYDENATKKTSFNDRPMFFAKLLNTLSFKKNWQLELGSEIHSKGYTTNIYLSNTYCNLTAAVQKAFLKDGSLVVRLEGADLCGLGDFDVHTDYGSYTISQTNRMDTMRLTLSVRYRFNSAQSKYKGTGAGRDAVSRISR
ncbi:MAG: TonB-dependent receptor domain-containing protein [Candidatus Cryptobacteroides sp.]